jgi:hypothetical protein
MARAPRQVRAHGPERPRAAAAPRTRRAQRCRAARPRPGSPPIPRTARPRRTAPAPVFRSCPRPAPAIAKAPGALQTSRRGTCRRFRRRRRPGPGLTPSRKPGRQPPRAPARRESRDRRGLRLPPQISVVQGPARPVPRRPGPAARDQADRDQADRDQADSVLAARGQVPRGRQAARDQVPRHRQAARPAARPLRALPVRAPRGRVLPGPVAARRVPVLPVPARGRVTTRSARPRPAWDRRRRPGRRVPSPVSRPVRASRSAALPVPQGLVARVRPASVGQAGPARPMAGVPAARVLAVPGRAP